MTDAARFAALVAPLLERAGAYARTILRNRDDAGDAVQEAALRGLERFDTFDPALPFKAWWFAIVRNCCIDILRSAQPDHVRLATDDASAAARTDGETDAAEWVRLNRAIDALSVNHRDILRLRYFADLSYRELAAVLDIPAGTVMSRLHLARQALANEFTKERS
jgi:RNA polymerase sigma-70 factor, ECF subfamily